ncbi:MAG: phosphoribosylanthranilate isomerase [Actinomycetota bacterium]
MRIKICGATSPADIQLLAGLGIDFVGLWYGIPGGHAELPLDKLEQLAAQANATEQPQPVLVTFLNEVEALRDGVLCSGVHWVQLHGYQPPSVVRALKVAVPEEVKVVKVLHVSGHDCVERMLIRSYERAGVDIFLLDAVAEDGRVGSTGQRLDPRIVPELIEQMTRPCFLGGGVSAESCRDHRMLLRHPRFFGIDVDTGARGPDGKFCVDRIAGIGRTWKAFKNGNAAP